jgi:hypothetical protein
LFHLVMAYQAGLLHHQATTGENGEVGYAANVEALRKLRVLLGIDFEHHSFASHVSRGFGYFRSGGATGAAPLRPEIYQDGNRAVLNDFIE